MKTTKKNIVVIGAGFAGLRLVKDLQEKLDLDKYSLTLIDKRDVHMYTPDLYEIGTAFSTKITNYCMSQLTDTVAIPIEALIDNRKMDFICDWVSSISHDKRELHLKKTKQVVKYDILVLALGSVLNYFDIPGMKEHAFSIKTITEALKLNCHIDMHFKEMWEKKKYKKTAIVVGGGGATGVEVAAELPGYIKKLSHKYGFDPKDVTVTIVEGNGRLAQLNQSGTDYVKKCLSKNGVRIELFTRIKEVTDTQVRIEKDNAKKTLPCDILVWTGGVKVHPLVSMNFGDDNCRGHINIDHTLRSVEYDDVWAIGDCACYLDHKTSKRIPMLAQIAYKQGAVLAENICNHLDGKELRNFKPSKSVYLIPVGGKRAILSIGSFVFKGHWCYVFKRLITLKYFMSIMPFFKALGKWRHGSSVFSDHE